MIPQLRDYQEEIIRKIIQAKKDGFKAPLVVSPTGSGKTVMFAFLAADASNHGKRVQILVHRIEILQQTVKSLFNFGVQSGTVASGQPMTTDLIQTSMIQTLTHRMDQMLKPDIIMPDEAHHSVASTWLNLLKKYPDTFRIGWTATPERASGEGLITCFDTMIEGPTTRWLVNEGFLCRPRYFLGPNISAKPEFHLTRGDYDKKEQMQARKKRVYIGNVISHYKEHLDGLPSICFCVSVDHCHLMEDEFRAAGYRSKTVHGKMKKPERDAAIAGLATGEIQVVCSCDVISEGVDVPVVAGIILLRRMKSLSLFLQQVGRGLRPVYTPGMPQETKEQRLASIAASTKPFAIVLDHAGAFYEHGHPLLERIWSLFSKKRSQREKITPPETSVCPACGGCFEGKVNICPDCGFNIENHRLKEAGKKTPEEIEGILTEVMDEEATLEEIAALKAQAELIQKMSPADRQRQMIYNLKKYGKSSSQIKGLIQVAGYKTDWTESVYRRIRK